MIIARQHQTLARTTESVFQKPTFRTMTAIAPRGILEKIVLVSTLPMVHCSKFNVIRSLERYCEANPNACENGGKCTSKNQTDDSISSAYYECDCTVTAGYYGHNCTGNGIKVKISSRSSSHRLHSTRRILRYTRESLWKWRDVQCYSRRFSLLPVPLPIRLFRQYLRRLVNYLLYRMALTDVEHCNMDVAKRSRTLAWVLALAIQSTTLTPILSSDVFMIGGP